MSVPVTRELAYVLREQLNEGGGLQLILGKVTAVPDSRHCTVTIGGTAMTVPKLSSYAAAVNDVAYLLAGPSILLAIGTVK